MVRLQPEWIAPARTALLLIDMQADFGAPDGMSARMGADVNTAAAAIVQAGRLADAARAAGVAPIFVGLQTRGELDSAAWRERMRRLGEVQGNGFCREGTPGAQFIGPRPLPGETVIVKRRYSGFHGTSLDAALKARNIDTLVVCGLTTECCIDSTVRDAFHRDYHIFIAADACAAYEAELHRAALASLERSFAISASVDDVIAAWKNAGRNLTPDVTQKASLM